MSGAGNDRSKQQWPTNGLRARTALQTGDPQRYSQFVAVMKRVLLLLGLAIIVAVGAYSLQPRQSNRVAMNFARLTKIANDLAMIKPRLHGTDARGDRFLITAERAVQTGPSAHQARLYNVQADITLHKGLWISASAKMGYLDVDRHLLRLVGALSVYASNGYELHTDDANVNLASGEVSGNGPITGQGPGGTLSAQRFEIDRTHKTINLIGNVHMQFFLHGAKA